MTEQVHRQRRARRDDEWEADEASPVVDTAAVEEAECCLADIDEALAESEACCAAAEEVLKPKTWREMTDQELLDAGDIGWTVFWHEYQAEHPNVTTGHATSEFYERRERYDQAYQQITGVVNHRDCGCGC